LVPWRSTLPSDIPSFGFAGQSITAASSVMLAGPALSAFARIRSWLSRWVRAPIVVMAGSADTDEGALASRAGVSSGS